MRISATKLPIPQETMDRGPAGESSGEDVHRPSSPASSGFSLPSLFAPFRSSHAAPRTVNDAAELDAVLAGLDDNERLLLLVALPGDERNAVYDPVFEQFSRRGRYCDVYLRTENAEIAVRYKVATFPTVLILSGEGEGDAYAVRDRLAVNEERTYYQAPTAVQLERIAGRFTDADPGARGSSVLAYGLTAASLDDPAEAARAATRLIPVLEDVEPAVVLAGLDALRRLASSLSRAEAALIVPKLSPLFDAYPEPGAEAMGLFAKLAPKLDAVTARQGLDILPRLFLHFDPAFACIAVHAYAQFAPVIPRERTLQTLPTLKALFHADDPYLRWAALYAYGESRNSFSDAEIAAAFDHLMRFFGDPYAGARHRALILAEALLPRFSPDQRTTLAPELRALFGNLGQQVDVTVASIALYVRLTDELGSEELRLGVAALQTLLPDESEAVRLAAISALKELIGALTLDEAQAIYVALESAWNTGSPEVRRAAGDLRDRLFETYR